MHFYKFYGYDFVTLGFLFFPAVIATHSLSWRFPQLRMLSTLMVAAAIGTEINFIRVQKYVIGQWCPVCISIATFVGLAALVYVVEAVYFVSRGDRGDKFMYIQRGVASLVIIFVGFFISFFGVAKPSKSFADGLDSGKNPVFGNKNSNIEVYVITDWFCDACSSVDSRLDRIYPLITPKVRLYFIDYAIHPETMNYIPYNLSFMLNNKDKYFQIRHVLHDLAQKTLAPTPDEVKKAVKPLGIKYKQLNYSDVDSGIRFFKGIRKSFDVKRTPTVVIANRKTLEAKKLVGANEITEQNIMNAIQSLQ